MLSEFKYIYRSAYSNVQRELRARVVELVDTWVLKTHGLWLRGFKSLLAHHNFVPHRGGLNPTNLI